MVLIVIMARAPLQGALVGRLFEEDRRFEVSAVVSDWAESQSDAQHKAPTEAQVIIYIPDGSMAAPPGGGNRCAVVVGDVTGAMGLERALTLGARGYVCPTEAPSALVQRVLRVAQGEVAFPPGALAQVQATLRLLTREDSRRRMLTPGEQQIVEWVAGGLLGKEIAGRLQIKEKSAYSRISRIAKRLGLRNERELAAWATLVGLYPGETCDTAGE